LSGSEDKVCSEQPSPRKRSLVFQLATGNFIAKHDDGLFIGPPGTGKSHLAQAIGQAVIQQGYRVLYRETQVLLDELAGGQHRRRPQRLHGQLNFRSSVDHG